MFVGLRTAVSCKLVFRCVIRMIHAASLHPPHPRILFLNQGVFPLLILLCHARPPLHPSPLALGRNECRAAAASSLPRFTVPYRYSVLGLWGSGPLPGGREDHPLVGSGGFVRLNRRRPWGGGVDTPVKGVEGGR